MVWTSSKWVNFEFEVKFDLEGQCQLPPKTIRILTKVFCFSGPNLVILAWTGDELSCRQGSDWYTHRHRHTQATTIPGGQNWPRVKMGYCGQEKNEVIRGKWQANHTYTSKAKEHLMIWKCLTHYWPFVRGIHCSLVNAELWCSFHSY